MNRNVIHIDIAEFHIAVERVVEPRLRDWPVAVAVETSTRSLVYAVSREAQQNGVRSGMLLHQARKFCPDLVVLPPNEDLYMRATTAMIEVLGRFSPVIEPLRYGHAYLDMTGNGKLFGGVKDAAAKAQGEIRERLRLDASVGLASNKLVSKVASGVTRPCGLCDVRHGYEERFLAPLQVGYLPGVKRKVREELLELNVRIIRELAAISASHLQMVFGRTGVLLYQRAHGIDNRPVQPPKRAPEVVETEILAEDSNDYFELRAILFRLLSQGARRLRFKKLCAGRMVIEIRYSDYKEDRGQQRFRATNLDMELFPVVTELLEKSLTRRVRVRKLTLRMCDLLAAPRQMALFEEKPDPKNAALILAMDRIRDQYGEDAIRFGRAA